MRKIQLIITGLLICLSTSFVSAKDYDAHTFGVKGDGVTVNTASIQFAIDYISKNGGGRLVFSAGTYRTGSIYLKSGVILHIELGATLMSTANPFDFVKDKYVNWMAMIFAKHQSNVGITGKGVIDGRGFETANNMTAYIQKGVFADSLLWDRAREPNRPQNIYFRECRNVTIKDITLKDPAGWNETYDQCVNVLVDGIKVLLFFYNNDIPTPTGITRNKCS